MYKTPKTRREWAVVCIQVFIATGLWCAQENAMAQVWTEYGQRVEREKITHNVCSKLDPAARAWCEDKLHGKTPEKV